MTITRCEDDWRPRYRTMSFPSDEIADGAINAVDGAPGCTGDSKPLRRARCACVMMLPMKVCIVSDSHDRSDPLAEAVRAAAAEGAGAVIHCGDVIGTQTLRAAMSVGLPLHVIHGNNLGDPVSLSRWAHESGGLMRYHGADARLDLHGRRIFVVHYPEYGHAMACTGDWDLVCCGHSHVAGVERVDNVKNGVTWVVNPGTVAGMAAPRTWVLGDLETMQFQVRTAS